MATKRSPLWVPDRAEIIFIQHNPQAGKEMPDDHPMLVISTKAFIERTGIVVGFPMTHSEQHQDNPFAIAAQSAKGEVGYALVHQPKSFDWRVRNGRPHAWGGGHTKLLAAALKRFDAIFGVCNH
jgi:mRNA interferase MazF